ncbi:MAG: GlcG/HbpS family heme-binding protein [Gammaproteobacteria bacterium]
MKVEHKLFAAGIVVLFASTPIQVFASDHEGHEGNGHQRLTTADCDAIIASARAEAATQDADFRAGDTPPRNHYACVNRRGDIVRFVSDDDAWEGSRDVAKAKAFTAMAFSSNENALTTRTIFCATQPGGPLWQLGNSNQSGAAHSKGSINQLGVIQFPGGVPIYIGNELVGGFGVSGDSVRLDEKTALAGTGAIYGARDEIKSVNVPEVGVSYQIGDLPGDACF